MFFDYMVKTGMHFTKKCAINNQNITTKGTTVNKFIYLSVVCALSSCQGKTSDDPFKERKTGQPGGEYTGEHLTRGSTDSNGEGKEPNSEKLGLETRVAHCNKPNIASFEPETYYAGVDTKSAEYLSVSLNHILRNHISYEYRCAWDMLKEADEDPDNSDQVITFYQGEGIPKVKRDRGGGDKGTWNREHVWSKSHGFSKSETYAYTDAHNLRPSYASVNSARSYKDFSNGGEPVQDCAACLTTDSTWEAPDVIKGDVARTMFYMAVRYNGGDKTGVGDLRLVKGKSKGKSNEFGDLCSLLAWHEDDPVSPEEEKRSQVIYNWQGNRNPFIDKPEWVSIIWGTAKDC